MPIVRRSVKEIRKHAGRVDWARVRRTTDRKIAAQIATDPDTAPDMAEARDLRRVYNPPVPNVKAIRHKLGLSQAAFAHQFGFSVRTVQQWEQGRAGATPFRWTVLGLRLDFLFAESFRS